MQVAALALDDSSLSVAGALLTMGLVVIIRNRQADYIEHHLFDDKPDLPEKVWPPREHFPTAAMMVQRYFSSRFNPSPSGWDTPGLKV